MVGGAVFEVGVEAAEEKELPGGYVGSGVLEGVVQVEH